jgi:hypothetical protein
MANLVGRSHEIQLPVPDAYKFADRFNDAKKRGAAQLTGGIITLNLTKLTDEEIASGKVKVQTYSKFHEQTSTWDCDFSAYIPKNLMAQSRLLATAVKPLHAKTTNSVLEVVKRSLLNQHQAHLDAYKDTYDSLGRSLFLFPPAEPPASIAADFASFHEKDSPKRTIILRATEADAVQKREILEDAKGLDDELEEPIANSLDTAIPIHDFVIYSDHAGGQLRRALIPVGSSPMREIFLSEGPRTITKLAEFLYHKQIPALNDDHEAQALFRLADRYQIQSLVPYCEAGARRQNRIDGNPALLPSRAQLQEQLDLCGTASQMEATAAKVRQKIEQARATYLTPHINSLRKE